MVDPQHKPQLAVPGANAWPQRRPTTADPGVDAILRRTLDLPGLDTAEHPDWYLSLHDALRAELDAEPQPDSGFSPGSRSGFSQDAPSDFCPDDHSGSASGPHSGGGLRPGPGLRTGTGG